MNENNYMPYVKKNIENHLVLTNFKDHSEREIHEHIPHLYKYYNRDIDKLNDIIDEYRSSLKNNLDLFVIINTEHDDMVEKFENFNKSGEASNALYKLKYSFGAFEIDHDTLIEYNKRKEISIIEEEIMDLQIKIDINELTLIIYKIYRIHIQHFNYLFTHYQFWYNNKCQLTKRKKIHYYRNKLKYFEKLHSYYVKYIKIYKDAQNSEYSDQYIYYIDNIKTHFKYKALSAGNTLYYNLPISKTIDEVAIDYDNYEQKIKSTKHNLIIMECCMSRSYPTNDILIHPSSNQPEIEV